MQNKGFIIFLTAVVTLLCIYYLSFTFVSRGVQKDATEFATDANGTVDFNKRQAYLDSVYKVPVYNFLGIEYTYEEVKDNELNLGLDLQGGMHVTLEVSPVEIVKGLAGDPTDPAFQAAIDDAVKNQRGSQEKFTTLFYEAFQNRKPNTKLSAFFANAANRGRIDYNTSDQEILNILDDEIEDAVDRSFNILRTRIDRFGTSQPNIQKLQGTGRIQVELPGIDNPERVRNLLQGVAQLEFLPVWNIQEIGSSLDAINTLLVEEQKANASNNTASNTSESNDAASQEDIAALLTENQPRLSDAGDSTEVATDSVGNDLESQLAGTTADSSALDSLTNTEISPLFSLLRSQFGLVYEVKDTAKINDIIQREDVQNLLPQNLKFAWDVKPMNLGQGNNMELLTLYALKQGRGGKAPLSGEVITDARQDLDQLSRPAVFMNMNTTGAKIWKRLTADAAREQRQIAIVLDDYVLSAPTVDEEIGGGSSVISGNFTIEEAKDLANLLKAGALPAPTNIVEDTVIGPSLGKEAIAQGLTSILVGLAMVVIFMVVYYAKGGLVANLALLFNIFFILGILAQLDASLTLPGIAGIVLTIGMAVDANVLIFERIREELRAGVGLKAAISGGYGKAYSSIIDSNVTTFLTAVILYVLGQGPVKGFAITLMVGIVCSFFSAVFISRVVIEWMARKGDQSKLSFSLPFSKNLFNDLNLDFISKRKVAYIFSGSVIVLGIIAAIIQPFQFGVDFTGGRSYVVAFEEPVTPSDLKVALQGDFENAGTEVKTYGANNVLKITTSYLSEIEDPSSDNIVKDKLIAGIQDFTNLEFVEDDSKVDAEHFTILSSSTVGATIANDVKNSSYESVIFSLVIIFLYILIRFKKWQFGLGAIVALFHDTVMVLAAFAIAGVLGFSFEIDQVFIAAILTVIGYSINDTVVIFDRVREELGLRTKSEFNGVINSAINNTLSRTLITSGTTLLVVLILFLFGGEVLRGFSFAVLIGILLGTYSSIYIATPIVLDLTKRGPAKVQASATATRQQPA